MTVKSKSCQHTQKTYKIIIIYIDIFIYTYIYIDINI